MSRFIGQRRVQGNEVGRCQQLVESFNELHLQTSRAGGGEIRIVGDHAHAECDRAAAKLASNSAHADNAERLVVKLDAFEFFPAPLLASQTCIGLRNFSRDVQHQRERVFGSRNGVAARCIEHDYAATSCRFNVDVINADPGATDYAKFARGVQHVGGHFGFAANNEPGELWNYFDELGRRELRLNRNFESAAICELVDTTL